MRTFSAMNQLAPHIESLIFAADTPVSLKEIKNCLEEVFGMSLKKEDLLEAVDQLRAQYAQSDSAIELAEIAGGYQLLTKPAFHPTVGTYLKQTTRKCLSRSALETLSIIAYKQPVTKSEMERIRGVNCDYAVQKLLEKELVSITGRSEGPGRPLLYGTSEKFMDYFGLKSLDDLPKPKDFKEPEQQIGEQAPIEEQAVAGNPPAQPAKEEEE
jgi:segregation and condensation protein B